MSEQTNDDLLKELNSMPEPEKKKKKKKKTNAKEEEKEELKEDQKEDHKEEAEDKEEEIKKDTKDDEDNEQENEGDNEEGEKKKKKKIVKKVVVKKKGKAKGNEAMLIKLMQEKKKKEKELQDKLVKEAAEEEIRLKKEEEELRKKEEEERIQEEIKKKKEEEEKKRLKEMNISKKDLALLEENKKKTEELLKKQGLTVDSLFESLKDKNFHQKKKKKTKKDEQKDEQKEERVEQAEDDKVVYNEDEARNVEEVGAKKYVVESNDDVNDWENALDEEGNDDDNEKKDTPETNKDEDSKKDSTKKEDEEKEEKEDDKEDDKEDGKKQPENKDDKKDVKPVKEVKPKFDPKLRAPIVCILGHVDAGKTKLLDKLRHSNVQLGEAGGITQQIGATFIPIENIKPHLQKIDKKFQIETKIPGILLIDTPGHASFTNLRSRGSGLCDIAVLVLNIEKGVEKQSVESIDLLRQKRTPFIFALNQFDRIHNWTPKEWAGFRQSYDQQKRTQQKRFDKLLQDNIKHIIQQNINSQMYDINKDMSEYINCVPTSAITGEGLPDLLGLLVYLSQKFLKKKIIFQEEVKCSVLEVKVTESIGTTIDVILVNGTLHVGDKVVVGGIFGPIKTTVKIILMPKHMKEMRVKCEYDRYDQISGAIGVKLYCPDLENALAGSPLYVYKTDKEAEQFCKEITQDFNSIVQDFLNKKGKGLMVQASTLGSLEAILTFLKEQKVDVCVVGVGNLNKKDVIKLQIKHSEDPEVKKEDKVILCFDNKVLPEAEQSAKENGIKIFQNEVIYHLFDQYILFKKQCIQERKKAKEKEAIFPCMLKTVMFINKKDPLIIGVDVEAGVLKTGTPIYCIEKKLPIGVVEGMEKDHKPINNVKPNDGSISIRVKCFDSSLLAGRHFDDKSTYCAYITRNSIDVLKAHFRDDMTDDDWRLIIKIKKILEIQ